MSKILILGAGASYGHGANSNHLPPLIDGMFTNDLSAELILKYYPLSEYIKDTFDIIINKSKRINFEKLYSDIEPIWELDFKSQQVEYKEHLKSFSIFSPLDYLRGYIVDLIFATTSWLTEMDCPFHKKIAKKWLCENDTVISFNYDLIMDFALMRNTPWKPNDGYGWEYSYSQSIEGMGSVSSKPYIKLLKPHGSLNFKKKIGSKKKLVTRYNLKNIPNNNYSDIGNDPPEYDEYETIDIYNFDKLIKDHKIGIIPNLSKSLFQEDSVLLPLVEVIKSNLGLASILPFIIMPTLYKPFNEMRFGELNIVWRNLFDSLKQCTEILSCGFSFSDTHFNQVFREAIRNKQTPIKLLIIEPDEHNYSEIVRRLENHNVICKRFGGTLADFTNTI